MKPVRSSIARLAVTAVALLTTVIMTVFLVMEYLSDKREYDRLLAQELTIIPDQLAAGLALPLWNVDMEQSGRLVEAVMTAHVIHGVTVRGLPGGEIIISRHRAPDGTMSAAKDNEPPPAGLLFASRVIVHDKQALGTVEVALTTAPRDASLRQNVYRLVTWVFILNAVLITGVYFLLRGFVLIPLGEVEAYAAKVSRGEADPYVGRARFRGETLSLKNSIESMVAELSQRLDDLQISREALAQAEQRYRQIFERAQIGIFQTTWRGRFIAANPAMAELFGFMSPESLVASGINVARFYLDPEERGRFIALLGKSGEVDSFTIHFKRTDGSIRIGSLRARASFGPTGKPLSIEGLMEDITERVNAREALIESKKLYQSLVENLPLSIMTFDKNGKINYVNQFHLDTFAKGRLDADFFLGRSLFELPGVVSSSLAPSLRELLAGQPLFLDGVYIPRLSGGGSGWQSLKGIPLTKEGEPVGGILIREDITARKMAEKNLDQARKHITNILDSMPSVVIGVDKAGLVTHFNKAAERDSGIAAAKAVGRPVEDIYPVLSQQMRLVTQSIERGQPAKTEKITRARNGHLEYDDVLIYPLVANGAVGAVVRIDDVTERVRIEELMIQSEKMMSLGGLAAGMAHEINNPLGAVLQGVQNVLRRLDPALPANARAVALSGVDPEALARYIEARRVCFFLEGVSEAGERAARIVAGMLEFSRRGVAEPVMVDAAGLIEKTIALAANDYDLKKLYDFRQIEIERNYDPALPHIPCIPTEIEQVILNLLKNAAQALAVKDLGGPDAAGRLDGENPRITVSTRREGSSVCIEVADNGPGMSEEVRRRAFEPFFTTKEPGTGTGLGLSVSYFIVSQNHGGELSVASTPGQGTAFTIRLPLAQPALDRGRKEG